MAARLHRRDVLRGAAAAGLASPLAACARPVASALEATSLADGVVMIAGAGGNVVAARGPEGAVLIDGGLAAHAEDLIGTVKAALSTRRIAKLLNTHWHHEQTGANAALAAQGATIAAHENTRLWLGTTIYRRWEEKTYPPAPPEARPTESFYTSGETDLGDERLAYGHVRQAHTDGDIYALFAEADVLAAGGIVSGAGWPIVDWSTGGWLGGMVDGVETLIGLCGESTRIVPADGPVLGRADLERQHAMYTTILERLAEHLYASHGPEEVLAAAPTAEFDAEMGDPTLFVTLAFQSVWGHMRSDRRVSSF